MVLRDFSFLHAADLHLDSPLIGLSGRAADLASRIDQASRRAFDRLVDLAITERCRFVVLAGDVFDGDLREFRSGLFFLGGMSRLREAGIPVYMVAGNHDAENRFFDKLRHSDNVHRFDHRRSHTFTLDDVGVAIHGRSFGQREVVDNIALGYPRPHPAYFNVGVLHTACQGAEGRHARYAPCSVEQLVNHGYDYWALGHVHDRAVLHERPYVVYTGNIQGRSVRETGPKGATIVHVEDGAVTRLEHRDLDEVRWASAEIDLGGETDGDDLRVRVLPALQAVIAAAGDRPIALRLRLHGETPSHARLLLGRAWLREDVEAMLATLPGTAWLEKLVIDTVPPSRGEMHDPSVAGRLSAEVRLSSGRDGLDDVMAPWLDEVRGKMPAGGRIDELLGRLRAEAPGRAVELALALIERDGGVDEVR